MDVPIFNAMLFEMFFCLVAMVAGAVATVTGFGIGSFLTPTLALATSTKLAVAAVTIPHVIGSGVRLWRLRQHLDMHLLWNFGLMSALGGLTGALLHTFMQSGLLTMVFGLLLLFAGLMGLTGIADRMKFYGRAAWAAGFISGTLGGLVGTQGGIRAGASSDSMSLKKLLWRPQRPPLSWWTAYARRSTSSVKGGSYWTFSC